MISYSAMADSAEQKDSKRGRPKKSKKQICHLLHSTP